MVHKVLPIDYDTLTYLYYDALPGQTLTFPGQTPTLPGELGKSQVGSPRTLGTSWGGLGPVFGLCAACSGLNFAASSGGFGASWDPLRVSRGSRGGSRG